MSKTRELVNELKRIMNNDACYIPRVKDISDELSEALASDEKAILEALDKSKIALKTENRTNRKLTALDREFNFGQFRGLEQAKQIIKDILGATK